MPNTPPFTDEEVNLISEGLFLLRKQKVEALDTLLAAGIQPGGRAFAPHDLGIPQIDRLLDVFNEEQASAELTEAPRG